MTATTTRFSSLVRSTVLLAAASLLALLQLSCSATSLTPTANPMPAARASLRPEYRVFYDELQEYGDWVLIEPYGFAFRPKTRFGNWSPYSDGFWSASDSYGFVWVSGEPYGWATYHYGAWVNDPFQGYVWIPGLEWAPAWVSWTGNSNYVGWAAMSPTGSPAGAFNVVQRADLGATDLHSKVLAPEKVSNALKNSTRIENFTQVDNVRVNLGPRIDWVEQATGPLKRVRIEDSSLRRDIGGTSFTPAPAAPGTQPTSAAPAAPAAQAPWKPLPAELKREAESAAAEARSSMQQKQAPAVIKRIQWTDAPPRPAPSAPGRGFKPARSDSSR